MRFLNPRTDYAFKKVFASATSRDILISFLNAVLELTGDDVIIDVVISDPYQGPKIHGMKESFLDVKVTDQRGRIYIIEMQLLNVKGFEKRVLYNTCKGYVNQLSKGGAYWRLNPVVAITVTDFVLFPELHNQVTRFELCAKENRNTRYQDLMLVFIELPKFTLTEHELKTTQDRWLYFLKTTEDLTAVPAVLADEPAILQALDVVNRASWNEDELDAVEKHEMWLADQRRFQEQLESAEQYGIEQGIAQGIEKGIERGIEKGKADILLKLLQNRFGDLADALVERIKTANTMQLDQWIERLLSAQTITDIFPD